MDNAEIARLWRSIAVSSWKWRRAANQAGSLPDLAEGEAGGFFVTCDELGGRRAYLKPRRRERDPERGRAVREKIAADLAHDLDVMVPPVLLTQREKPGTEEEWVAVSLVMYPRQWSWEHVRGCLTKPSIAAQLEPLMANLPSLAARAYPSILGSPKTIMTITRTISCSVTIRRDQGALFFSTSRSRLASLVCGVAAGGITVVPRHFRK